VTLLCGLRLDLAYGGEFLYLFFRGVIILGDVVWYFHSGRGLGVVLEQADMPVGYSTTTDTEKMVEHVE
jgi:hypothetical protein